MNSVVRRVAPPVLLALVATGLAAAPAGAAPTWVAPAVTLAQGTSHARGTRTSSSTRPATPRRLGGARRRRGRRPRAGLDAPGRRLVVGAGRHLGLGRHRRLDRHRHQRERLRGSGLDPRHRFDVLEAATRAPGGAWSAPVPVSDSTVDAERPQVGVDAAGNAVVTFVAANAAPRTLRYATKPVGGPWSAADDLSDPAEGIVITASTTSSSRPSGQATVAWQLYLPLPTDRRVIQSAVRAGRWQPSVIPRPSRRPPRTPGSPPSR